MTQVSVNLLQHNRKKSETKSIMQELFKTLNMNEF